ncbi:MAG: hypothetical protein ACI4M8_01625 [Christensenellales bacterium]
MAKQKIVFFIQTHKPIGGSQVLFLNLASFISQNYEQYECFYINYKNKEVENIYGNSNMVFCDVNTDYTRFEDAIFFTPINYIFYLVDKIKELKKARICVYFYHPQIFDWINMQIMEAKVDFDPLLKLLSEHHACSFMDSSNYIAANRLSKVNFEPIYVPVTLSDNLSANVQPEPKSETAIRIGWLGRLDRDKIFSVLNVADNLLDLTQDKPIEFHIIGDGNSKNLIKFSEYTPKIKFIFTSYLYGEERNTYIRENIDIMVAMGISAIDSAVLRIPTVIPVVSPVRFNDDKYTYVHDVKGFSLGWDLKDFKQSGCKAIGLEQVVDDVYKYGRKECIGKEDRDFVTKEFAIAKGAEMFIEAIGKTTLTVEDCLKCSIVNKQMRRRAIYQLIRKRSDYESFHEFCARVKRINLEKNLYEKIKRIWRELNKTFTGRKMV